MFEYIRIKYVIACFMLKSIIFVSQKVNRTFRNMFSFSVLRVRWLVKGEVHIKHARREEMEVEYRKHMHQMMTMNRVS
jgi:hypothetical protein